MRSLFQIHMYSNTGLRVQYSYSCELWSNGLKNTVGQRAGARKTRTLEGHDYASERACPPPLPQQMRLPEGSPSWPEFCPWGHSWRQSPLPPDSSPGPPKPSPTLSTCPSFTVPPFLCCNFWSAPCPCSCTTRATVGFRVPSAAFRRRLL